MLFSPSKLHFFCWKRQILSSWQRLFHIEQCYDTSHKNPISRSGPVVLRLQTILCLGRTQLYLLYGFRNGHCWHDIWDPALWRAQKYTLNIWLPTENIKAVQIIDIRREKIILWNKKANIIFLVEWYKMLQLIQLTIKIKLLDHIWDSILMYIGPFSERRHWLLTWKSI